MTDVVNTSDSGVTTRRTSMTDLSHIVRCEVCDLPHNRGVEVCEECGHRLGTAPDLEALRRELPGLRGKIAGGVALCLGMLALNEFLFGGFGYIIFLAPVAWTVFSVYRYRILTKRLKWVGARLTG